MSIFWDKALPLMDNQKVKPADLARLTGKNKSSVSDWINKDILPKVDDAVKIADKLKVSVRYLVTGEDSEIPIRIREVVELCRGLDDNELNTVLNMLRGLQKRDYPESGTEVG